MALFANMPVINFMAGRRVAVIISAIILVLSLGSFFVRGLNLGIDFEGGLLLEVGYEEIADLAEIRLALAENGFEPPQVQSFG